MQKTLREILKEKNIPQSIVSEALGIQPGNLRRYDNLMDRSVNEILIISNSTGIDPFDLIGISMPSQPKELSQKPSTEEKAASITPERLLSIIESQQRTIENLSTK